MAVDRALWLSVSWGWILLWVVTVAAFVMVVVLAVRWVRRGEPEPPVPGLLFYVHGQRMIDLSKTGRFDPAVTSRLVKQFTATRDGKLLIGSGESGDGSAVVGEVLAGLRAAHGLVDVDLTTATITADESWRRTKPRRLSEIRDYVSIYGRFELEQGTGEVAVLRAHVGEHRVRVECERRSLRDTVPARRFNARCLGRVEEWDEDTGEVVVLPVAVFR